MNQDRTSLLVTLPSPDSPLQVTPIQTHSSVSICVEGVVLAPKDANGNSMEAFTYNGATYLPVQIISQALDREIQWDDSTSTIHVGKHLNSISYLLAACPPIQTDHYDAPAAVIMAGVKYANCITTNGYAIFNLNGQYDTLYFLAGHIAGEYLCTGRYNIYLDGRLAFSIDLDPKAPPTRCTVPLNHALQMKIEGTGWAKCFALADIQVS